MTKKMAFSLTVAAFLLGCLATATASYVHRGWIVPARQIETYGRMQFWQSVLADAEKNDGSYPVSLEEALDRWMARRGLTGPMTWDPFHDKWGHPLRYARLSEGFLLASFGSDGDCDWRDLQSYESWRGIDESPCFSTRRDTVITQRGLIKGCGK